MGTGADVRDILELTGGDNDGGPISKKDIINSDKVREKKMHQRVNDMFSVHSMVVYTLVSELCFSITCALQKKAKKTTETLTFKRPEGMHREVYALLYSDKK